uniref:Core protein n=1 Tax=viral metagenome TaxID=1070528 RepID=A0A6C0CCW9_9ZZZZ
MAEDRKRVNPDSDNKTDNSEIVRRELDKLRNNRTLSRHHIMELAQKYPEAVVDEIMKADAKRTQRIRRIAAKVAEKVARKYQSGNRPLHEILNKMLKYKTENKWTDIEYEFFRSELEKRFDGRRMYEVDNNQLNIQNRSRINKMLGYKYHISQDDQLKIKDSEGGTLAEILSMYERSLSSYRSNYMSSILYEDSALQATTGKFDRTKNVASNHVHPLLVAMFIPKIGLFESQILHSNMGGIVKSRYEGKPILVEADAMLFNDMVTDPNDVVCEESSPILDVKKRYQVQIDIWDIVTNLRNGLYYHGDSNQRFLTDLHQCRNNLYDNADLIYSQDEGAILRRLMSVFSLRPTLISTRPILAVEAFLGTPWGSGMNLGMGASGFGVGAGFGVAGSPMGSLPFVNQPVITVTKIPMITLQLPYRAPDASVTAEPVNINAAINQHVWLNENKTIVPKEQSIIHSREVLIFYVNRRIQRVTMRSYTNPIAFSHLPLTMSNLEKLNDYPVTVQPTIKISTEADVYELRSVVAVQQTSINPCPKPTLDSSPIIIGSIGLVKVLPSNGAYNKPAIRYDPFGASIPIEYRTTADGPAQYVQNPPMTLIDATFPGPSLSGNEDESFDTIAATRGTIYIYAKPCEAGGNYSCLEFINLNLM